MHRISAPTAAHVNGSYVRHHARVDAEDRVPLNAGAICPVSLLECSTMPRKASPGGGTKGRHGEKHLERNSKKKVKIRHFYPLKFALPVLDADKLIDTDQSE